MKTEKEKMLGGELYNAMDPVLYAERVGLKSCCTIIIIPGLEKDQWETYLAGINRKVQGMISGLNSRLIVITV